MTPRSSLPIAAALLAALATVSTRANALVLTLSSGIPNPGTLSLVTLAGRVGAFLLVFVVLFALAVRLGDGVDTSLAGVSGLAGTLGGLVAGIVLLLFIGSSQPLIDGLLVLSTTVITGVQAGVVVLAGGALGGR